MHFFVDNTEVSSQQSHSLPVGGEGRCGRSVCCAVRGTVATSVWRQEVLSGPLHVWCSSRCCLHLPYVSRVLLFLICLQTLKENLSLLPAESAGGADGEETLTDVKDSLNDVITLCHQSCQSLSQQQREVWWWRGAGMSVPSLGGWGSTLVSYPVLPPGPVVPSAGDHDGCSKTSEGAGQ